MNFAELTTPRLTDDGAFVFDMPDGWQQGRGAFGGIVLAPMVRALAQSLGDAERTLRALTAEIVGPVQPGPTRIDVTLLRAGAGMSTATATLSQSGAALAHAVGIFGRAREGTTSFAPAPPALPSWREVAQTPFDAAFAPRFAQHFDFRLLGALPFAGAAEPVTHGWVRLRDPGPLRDDAYVVALADAWFPSAFVSEKAPRPMATVAFTLEVLGTLEGVDPAAPLYHRGRSVAGRDGYVVDFRELWGEDGRLVALNQQTFVVVK